MTKPRPLPYCECCHVNLAIGPLTLVCAECYTELKARIAAAPSFRSPAEVQSTSRAGVPYVQSRPFRFIK